MPIYRRARSLVVLLAAAALVALAAPHDVGAFPIPPRSLRLQVETSNVIVVAKVLSSERPDTPGDAPIGPGAAVATLLVEETLLAPAPLGERIEVPYPANLMCPAPPSYDVGSTILAFLTLDETGAFRTVGLSYGTKDVSDPEARSAYTARVREMVEIQRVTDRKRRKAETLEWLVRCAESPHTAYDAVMELEPGVDSKGKSTPGLMTQLSREQRERLVLAVVSSPTLGHGTLSLVDLLLPLGDERLVPRMRDEVDRVSRAAEVEEPWLACNLLGTYARAIGWEQGETLIDAILTAQPNYSRRPSAAEHRRSFDAYFEALAARGASERR